MLDLSAPVECVCSGLCSGPDGLCVKGLFFPAEVKRRTLNYARVAALLQGWARSVCQGSDKISCPNIFDKTLMVLRE